MMGKTATLVDREHDNGNESTLKSRIRLESRSLQQHDRGCFGARDDVKTRILIMNGAFFV